MNKEYSLIDHAACMGRVTVLYEVSKVIQDKIIKEQKLLKQFKEQENQEKHNGQSKASTD
jgi:hypothetical protein